jgi:prepilin signal peptidase PulO-like enzyme (type II secretory pathway)
LNGVSFSPEDIVATLERLAVQGSREGQQLLARLAIDLPPEAWWASGLVLLALGLTALFDAFKGRVPDALIFLGLFLITAAQGFYADWPLAGQHLLFGFGAAFALWAANQLYYNTFRHDAIGMGDAKWTALAVAAFGVKPVLWAWVLGAWLGLSWMALKAVFALLRQLFRPSVQAKDYFERVHFAPFLFLGLLAGLYWNYLR